MMISFLHSTIVKTVFTMVAVGLVLPACTEFIAEVEREEEWQVEESDAIAIHYRRPHFSEAPSPGEVTVRRMLTNQNFYYRAIQDSIRRDFHDKVLLYLFNRDEAEEAIGTNTGGHAIPKFNTVYYTFIPERPSYTDPYGVTDPVVGAHELAHVITHRSLGIPPTKMMSEGYAVWLDGFYAGRSIEDWLRYYRDQAPDKIMTPEQLLNEAYEAEYIFYPNAGFFIRFLVRTYGVETANQLFTSKADRFRQDFNRLSRDSWKEMKTKYTDFREDIFQ